MELKQFSHRELKAINNGAVPAEKLPGFANGIPSVGKFDFSGARAGV